MSPVSVTRTLIVTWERPRYELLDSRGEVIEALAKLDIVRGFSTTDDSVEVVYQDGRIASVQVPQLVIIEPYATTADAAQKFVQATASALRASQGRVRVDLQHLVALAAEEEAAAAQQRVSASLSGLSDATDFAMLVDGEQPDFSFQAEYGVVARDEIPDRIARRRGRTIGTPIGVDVDKTGYAPVSMFVDSTWKLRRGVDVHTAECWNMLNQVDKQASSAVEQLHTGLMGGVKGVAGDCA